MTTFERLYVEDASTHTEVKDPYYTWYNEEAVCRRAVVLDGGGVARKADDRVRAVVQQRLNALHLGGEGFRVALQQRLRVRQEVVVINARGVGVEVETNVRLGHGAVQLRHVDFLLIGLLHRLAEQRDIGGNQRRVGELALEKQLVEQRVAGSHIGVRRLPAGADVGAEALRVVCVQHRQLHHAVVEVAALKRVNIRRGMLRGAQRANQVEVQVQPVDVLLRPPSRQCGGCRLRRSGRCSRRCGFLRAGYPP